MPLGVRDILLIVRAKDQATRVLAEVGGALSTLEQAHTKAQLAALRHGAALLGVGTALSLVGVVGVAALGALANAAIDYNAQASLTLTQTQGLNTSLEQVKSVGIEVAKAIPAPFKDMQSALYDIFSSMDVNVAQAQVVLGDFAKEAVAGQVSIRDAGRETIAILNAYKLDPVRDLTKVLDFQFQLVKEGVGTFGEFATTIGRAIPSAIRAGQSYQQLGGMLAFLTRNGLSTTMAATSAARALDAMSNVKVVTRMEAMGISVKNASGEFRPMTEIVGQLSQKLAGMTSPERAAALAQLFQGAGGTIQARRFFDLAIPNFQQLLTLTDKLSGDQARGAMQKAYEIMFHSPQAQIQLLKNNLQILATQFGDVLLPIIGHVLLVGQNLVHWFQDLSPHAKEVIVIFIALASATALLSGAIIAGAGAIQVINASLALAGLSFGGIVIAVGAVVIALAAAAIFWHRITGFISDNKDAVVALAGVLVAVLIPALVSIATTTLVSVLETMYLKFLSMIPAVRSLAASLFTLQGAMLAISLIGLGAVIYGISSSMSHANSSANKLIAGIKEGHNLKTTSGLADYGEQLYKTDQALRASYKSHGGFINFLRIEADLLPGINNGQVDFHRALQKVDAKLRTTGTALHNFRDNQYAISQATGVSMAAVEDFAVKSGTDLTHAFANSGDARQKMIDDLTHIGDKAGLTTTDLMDMGAETQDEMTKVADLIAGVMDTTEKAFFKANDIVGELGAKVGTTSNDIKKFYTDHIKSSQAFANNISTAIQRGYDPQLIARILEAGPAQAGPLLQAMVNDHSQKLVDMVNKSEDALNKLSSLTVQMARATQMAINSTTDQMAHDLPLALKVIQAEFAAAGTASAQVLAEKLHESVPRIEAIAHEFNITVPVELDTRDALAQLRSLIATGNRQQIQVAALTIASAGHAAGGHVLAGQPGIVGEKGWEFFIPDVPGRIISHDESLRMASHGRSANMGGMNIEAGAVQMIFQGPVDSTTARDLKDQVDTGWSKVLRYLRQDGA